MNKIFLIGNLTADPELRTTSNNVSVCTMTIAVNRRFSGNRDERQTEFFRITAWRQLGETCSRFLSKGRKIAVIGELSARTYEAKDGSTRVSLEVTADEIEFLSPRDGNQQQGGYQQQGYPQQGYPQQGGSQQGGYQQGSYQQQGYSRAYPQGGQNNPDGGTPLHNGPRSGGWQDGRGANDPGDMGGTSLNNSTDGFDDVTDDTLPF